MNEDSGLFTSSSSAEEKEPNKIFGTRSGMRYSAAAIDNIIAIFGSLSLVHLVPVKNELVHGLLVYVLFLAYFTLCEGLTGKTFGKWYLGLKVVSSDGGPCGLWRGMLRTIGRILDANPLFLGALPAALLIWFTPRRRHIGDFLAGTVVIRTDR